MPIINDPKSAMIYASFKVFPFVLYCVRCIPTKIISARINTNKRVFVQCFDNDCRNARLPIFNIYPYFASVKSVATASWSLFGTRLIRRSETIMLKRYIRCRKKPNTKESETRTSGTRRFIFPSVC